MKKRDQDLVKEGEWAISNTVMENTWCSSEKEWNQVWKREIFQQHQCKVGGITESQEKPLHVPMGKAVSRGAKGLLTAKDLEGVGIAPHPDHLQHGLDCNALFVLELLQFVKSLWQGLEFWECWLSSQEWRWLMAIPECSLGCQEGVTRIAVLSTYEIHGFRILITSREFLGRISGRPFRNFRAQRAELAVSAGQQIRKERWCWASCQYQPWSP